MHTFTIARARWLILPTILALWPAWIRQVRFGLPTFPIGLALFVLVCAFWLNEERRIEASRSGAGWFMFAAWLLILVYAVTYDGIPPLGSQILASLALGSTLLAAFPREMAVRRIAILALFPLTLPLEMALQFVLGFPFRVVTAAATAFLLSPYGVTARGSRLLYDSRPLEVDAACSGILGLWAFLIVGAVLSLVLRSRWPRLVITLAGATVASLCYNVLRASLLFMYRFHAGTETGFLHSLLGAAAFFVSMLAFTLITLRAYRSPVPFDKRVSPA